MSETVQSTFPPPPPWYRLYGSESILPPPPPEPPAVGSNYSSFGVQYTHGQPDLSLKDFGVPELFTSTKLTEIPGQLNELITLLIALHVKFIQHSPDSPEIRSKLRDQIHVVYQNMYFLLNHCRKAQGQIFIMDPKAPHPAETEDEENVLNSFVIEKYKTCAQITNDALAKAVAACTPGRPILEIADLADKHLLTETGKIYNQMTDDGPIEKGIAFPTSIAINECVGNYSPEDTETRTLKDGDVVKIDLGCHIDGYCTCASHTVLVSATPVTDRRADCITAAHAAATAAIRMLRPGNKTQDITAMIGKIAKVYEVSPVEGVLSHQLKRFVIDGHKVISNAASPERPAPDSVIEEGDVICLDIVMSTGTGKEPRQMADRFKPTIFKHAVEESYMLKLKASRTVFSEISSKFSTFPFTTRMLETKNPRVGLKEMLEHNMLETYPQIFEKNGEFVAQFKATVMVTPRGIDHIAGLKLPPQENVKSEKKLEDPEILTVLQAAIGTKKKKKPKK
ncbi:putative Proliferation-associated protein A [Blattamonas nauphoetae]|uniref:Proliferation-associated protein A n=1 Tax=Blattamonas nauphoetae TaxID=2049346 RepID=A0ABQ9XXQ8_9EUKA|nr:putative Proliferation-associated protein A [Blattamonas nauphoetae]